jgi:endonuclease G
MCVILGRHLIPREEVPVIVFEPELERDYLPSVSGGELILHQHYALSYLEKYEQAQWVAYELTTEELNVPRVPRTDWFYADDAVKTQSAVHRDYSNSGFTRGHLAPAADMAFDTLAMRESFYMSNISPQQRAFNGGIWRELEELVRDWARDAGSLYVVTGPVLNDDLKDRIGGNEVVVPESFYKVLFDQTSEKPRGIAFVVPNERSDRPLMTYAVSIDAVEALTGIDFFPSMAVDKWEATFDSRLWPVDDYRFRKRIEDWNYR